MAAVAQPVFLRRLWPSCRSIMECQEQAALRMCARKRDRRTREKNSSVPRPVADWYCIYIIRTSTSFRLCWVHIDQVQLRTERHPTLITCRCRRRRRLLC